MKGHHLVNFGLAGIGVSTLATMDSDNSTHFRDTFYGSDYLDFSDQFGSFKYVAPVSAAVFGSTLLTKNRKLQDAAFTSFQAVLNTALTVNTAKFIFARARPFEQEGAYDFDFFDNEHSSFPSGHASTAFALVTPWVVYYPGPATYALMAIPAGTALSRIAKGKHWLSDVAAGAMIGAWWGYKLSKHHLNLRTENLEITPFAAGSGGGFNLSVSF